MARRCALNIPVRIIMMRNRIADESKKVNG